MWYYRQPNIEKHPLFSSLRHEVVIGLIQLLIDKDLIPKETAEGIYLSPTMQDYRSDALPLYNRLNELSLIELLTWLKAKGYVNQS
ncbi:hypothetical protein AAKU52_002602 [Pedobacter sp. CG_S7]|uniref:hypothetical protein n=1 Tax=Pedobacter sp. CG_S7 TaxID=3143930 RepID=UPI00339A8C80